MIDFRGSTVVDCPKTLQTGIDIVVSLSVYILPKAFKPARPSSDDAQNVRNMFNEAAESLDEQELRERKTSLVQLFDSVGLRPVKGSGLFGKRAEADLKPEDVMKMAEGNGGPASQKVPRKEVVGDGEEIEVEADGEDLSDNELNMIYKRYRKQYS